MIELSAKLSGVHPTLIDAITKVMAVMGCLGHPMMVTDGVRSLQQQIALYALGRTAPGAVVTNCDGITKRSNHQTHADGWGHAVDCCFLDAEGRPSWDAKHPWQLYGLAGETLGLKWGGLFTSIVDRPHLELP